MARWARRRPSGLVIEVDGDACHAERVVADARRDEALGRAGYLVLRLAASLVERRPLEAVRLVQEALLGAGSFRSRDNV